MHLRPTLIESTDGRKGILYPDSDFYFTTIGNTWSDMYGNLCEQDLAEALTQTFKSLSLEEKDTRWLLKKSAKNLYSAIDHDYLPSLSADEAKWLANFDDAYYTGAKNEVSKSWSQDDFRASYRRNNARIRDIYNQNTKYDETAIDEVVTKRISKPTTKKGHQND